MNKCHIIDVERIDALTRALTSLFAILMTCGALLCHGPDLTTSHVIKIQCDVTDAEVTNY